MKRLILASVCVSLLTMSGVAMAKRELPAEDMRPRHEMKMHEDLAQKLNLTAEQRTLADKIREDGRRQMEPLMQERKALHEKMEKLRKENMEEFEKILTPEQKEAFAKFKEEHRPPHERMKKHRFGPRHDEAGRPEPKTEMSDTESKK